MSAIKFGKCFSKLMTPIALLIDVNARNKKKKNNVSLYDFSALLIIVRIEKSSETSVDITMGKTMTDLHTINLSNLSSKIDNIL